MGPHARIPELKFSHYLGLIANYLILLMPVYVKCLSKLEKGTFAPLPLAKFFIKSMKTCKIEDLGLDRARLRSKRILKFLILLHSNSQAELIPRPVGL